MSAGQDDDAHFEIASASTEPQLLAQLAAALIRTAGGGCSIALLDVGEPHSSHTHREAVATMRHALGLQPLASSELAQRALAQRGALTSSLGKLSDPLERARLALRADTVTVIPLIADRPLGIAAIYGRTPREETRRTAELLCLVAASTLARLAARRALSEVSAIRDMLAALTDRSPIPTAFFDHEHRFLAGNDAYRTYAGDALPRAPAIRRIIDDVLARREPRTEEVTFRRGAIGASRTVLVAAYPVQSSDAVAVSLVDLSARVRAEEVARAVADASSILSGATSVRAAREVLVDLALRWLGTRATLLDESSDGTFAPLIAEHARALRSGLPVAVGGDELAIRSLADERLRDIQRALLIPLGDDQLLAVAREDLDFTVEEQAFARDLARLARRAFDAAAARQEVQSWSELFADFIETVSRDLRDPITALVARLFLAEHAPDHEHLPALRRHAERLRDVAQRILAVAPRPPVPNDQAIDLCEVVRGAAAPAEALAVERGARVLLQIDSVAPAVVDPRRMTEALRDLFMHAARETPRDGLFCVRLEATSHETVITVSHNGPGLEVGDARRVFDALWDGRTDARALTIARALFSANGGRAWVETAPSTGTAYCFALPLEGAVSNVA